MCVCLPLSCQCHAIIDRLISLGCAGWCVDVVGKGSRLTGAEILDYRVPASHHILDAMFVENIEANICLQLIPDWLNVRMNWDAEALRYRSSHDDVTHDNREGRGVIRSGPGLFGQSTNPGFDPHLALYP